MDVAKHQIRRPFQRTGHDELTTDVAAVDDSGGGVDLSIQFIPGDCFLWVLAELYRAWNFKALPNRHFINSVTGHLNSMITSCQRSQREERAGETAANTRLLL